MSDTFSVCIQETNCVNQLHLIEICWSWIVWFYGLPTTTLLERSFMVKLDYI